MKLEILIKPEHEFKTRSDIAIHAFKPTYNELLDHIEVATRDNFDLIVIYSNNKESMQNIFASQSTWNKLRRDFGDVRYGEVKYSHGRSLGDGFTIYFEEVAS